MKFHDEIENRDYTFTQQSNGRWEMTVSRETVDLYEQPTTRIFYRIGNLTDADMQKIIDDFNTYDSIYQIA